MLARKTELVRSDAHERRAPRNYKPRAHHNSLAQNKRNMEEQFCIMQRTIQTRYEIDQKTEES